VRLIAKSFPCRYTTMAKDSKDGERLKERRTEHSRGTRKVIQQDFPSFTCQRATRHRPVDESTMNCLKSHNSSQPMHEHFTKHGARQRVDL
jgi:hypothetical protein